MKSDVSGLCQALMRWIEFIDLFKEVYSFAFEYFEIISCHLLTNLYLHYLGMLSLLLRTIICFLEENEHFLCQ